MTDDDLDRLDWLAARATEGPWEWFFALGRNFLVLGKHAPNWWENTAETVETRNAADAAFIAEARTAAPALVAEVRRLRRGLAMIVKRGEQGTPFGGCVIAEHLLAGREWNGEGE